MGFDNSNELRKKSHALIPGGAHTYAKGDDQFPELAPGFIASGEGCHVWDVDGNEYIEYGMGLRSVTLGHGFRPVVEAAYDQMKKGINFTRPSPIEIECAEELAGLIDCAEMVKFAKNGSDATSAAIKLARAYTDREMVAICSDHPFFSIDDWFIGTTQMSAGIPESTKASTVQFRYNDAESIRSLFERYPGKIACLIMEPERVDLPADGFLQEAKEICHQFGAVFILDEIITGFRSHLRGAQAEYNVKPDLSTFGKAMGNGFSVAALVGKREIMELGGIRTDRPRVFLLSTTNGAENHSLAAALETMRIYQREPVIEHLHRQGRQLAEGITQRAVYYGIGDNFGVLGRPCNLIYYTRDANQHPSQPFRTLFLQETIRQGLLMPSLVVSYSHSDEDIERTLDGIDAALEVYCRALNDGVENYLVGRPVKPVFRKFS